MTLMRDQYRADLWAHVLRPWIVRDRWRTIPVLLAVVFFSTGAAFVVRDGSLRFGVDSPVVWGPPGAPQFRIHVNGPDSGSPGYRAIVASSITVGTGLIGVVVLQLVVAAVAAIGLEGIGRSLGGRAGGLASFSLFAFNPDQLRWHAYLLPDSLYTSAVILALAAIERLRSSPTPGAWSSPWCAAWGQGV